MLRWNPLLTIRQRRATNKDSRHDPQVGRCRFGGGFFVAGSLMSGSVQQAGAVTPGRAAVWGGNGSLVDGGGPPVVQSGAVSAGNLAVWSGNGALVDGGGQRVALDAAGTTGVSKRISDGRVVVDFNGTAVFSIDPATGDVRAAGTITGSTTP